MTCGIYTITNLETNQIYVGQSRIVEQRWAQHRDKPAKKVKQLLTNVKDPQNIEYGILKEIPDYHLFDKDLISDNNNTEEIVANGTNDNILFKCLHYLDEVGAFIYYKMNDGI